MNKNPKTIKFKCILCGGYHEITFKDIIILIAINAVLWTIAVLRSCGYL
jgi:hypothetical protein